MLSISPKQVAQQKEDGTYSAFENLAKTIFYNGWNFFTIGVLEKQAERYNQFSDEKITNTSYLTASLVDSVASVASIAIGGRIATGVASRIGPGVWGAVAGSAAEGALATIIMKEGEVISYQLTNPGKLDSTYWKQSVTELTVATALSAGFPLLGAIMSGELRGNYKVMWNSPNELNPTQMKIVQPTPSNKSTALLGSAADSTGGSILSHAGGVLQTPGKSLIALPKTASMTVDEALAWQRALAPDLSTMLNKKASILEQAVQAVQLKNDFMVTARNAMDDANATAQLSMTTPARTFDEMLRARSKEYAGDALYKQVIADAKAEILGVRDLSAALKNDTFCFAGGTLIHTKNGLKPIESIQIGDWVLSQPESTGERAYKRVVRTTSINDKAVLRLRYYSLREEVDVEHVLIVTGNHPFYVAGHNKEKFDSDDWDDLPKRVGWRRADLLVPWELLELASGEMVRVSSIDPIWCTRKEGVGWIDLSRDSEVGNLIDLREGKTQERFAGHGATADFSKEEGYCDRYSDEEIADEWAYKCTVYNFEVEDFHTYYVGELGVWVHNTNCFENSLKPAKRASGRSLTSPDLEVYSTNSDVKALLATLSKPEGMLLVYEPISNQAAAWVKFQSGVEGGLRSKDGTYFLARTLLYKNPAGGENFIRLGDGAAYIRSGSTLRLSKTTIDAKAGERCASSQQCQLHSQKRRQHPPQSGQSGQ